jgi:hypothetical protein
MPRIQRFAVTCQNDASEFYDKLVDALEETLKRLSPATQATLDKCLRGALGKLKRCEVCQQVTAISQGWLLVAFARS